MSEVRQLNIVRNKPDESIVQALERVLESAKRGEFVGVVFAAQYGDGAVGTLVCRGEGSSIWTLMGAVQQLTRRLSDQAERL
jgi:hypothetical protein